MSLELATGVVLAGRYRLDQPLGEGGMGVVWSATHQITLARVALKFIKAAKDESVEQRNRFVREARAASAVSHPSVRKVLDVVELDDGTPVMVMELLSGESLSQRLAREEKLSLEDAAGILLPIVAAVGTAHAAGIIHRDLKPENIFLDDREDRGVKVLDFGIAKRVAAAQQGEQTSGVPLTGSGVLLGTPCYMSPEQAFGESDIDHRTDVWALGMILYQCLTGILPTKGANLGQILKIIFSQAIKPLREVAPEVPNDVADLVDRMLAQNRDERLGDLREATAVLTTHAGARVSDFGPPRSKPDVAGAAASDPAAGTSLKSVVRASAHEASVRKSPLRSVIGVVAAGATLAVGTWWLWTESVSPSGGDPPDHSNARIEPTAPSTAPLPAPAPTAQEPVSSAIAVAESPATSASVTPKSPASKPAPFGPKAPSTPPSPSASTAAPSGSAWSER